MRKRPPSWCTAAERIEFYVERVESGCWEWTSGLRPDGYARTMHQGVTYYAHRLAYLTFVGPIPEGMHLDHLCRNRKCVNPDHLEPVTPRENQLRSPISDMNKTHCPRGHAYEGENVRHWGKGRYCVTCTRVRAKLDRAMTNEERAERKAAGLPIVDLDAYFAEQVTA